MDVLVDSTGLQVYGTGQWLEEKHGARSRRSWGQLHLALDADGGEIIAHTMTDQDVGDASQVELLLDAQANDLKPSMDRIRCLMRRWSCLMRLFRYWLCRIRIGFSGRRDRSCNRFSASQAMIASRFV